MSVDYLARFRPDRPREELADFYIEIPQCEIATHRYGDAFVDYTVRATVSDLQGLGYHVAEIHEPVQVPDRAVLQIRFRCHDMRGQALSDRRPRVLIDGVWRIVDPTFAAYYAGLAEGHRMLAERQPRRAIALGGLTR